MSTVAESFVAATSPHRPEPAKSLRRCPVCGSEQHRAIHTQRYALFDDSRLPRETRIVACGDCGTIFAASHATAKDYRGHYARHSKYDTAIGASGSGESANDAKRLAELVELLAPHVANDSAILDVGAGRGGLLHAFGQRGFIRVSGIDPAEGCVAAMRAAGISAHVGELEADHWPTDPDRFDLIVLSHVLEHVFDAAEALHRVARRVSADGLVYLEVPDASRYTLDGFPPFYFFDPEHINHFDAEALEGLAGRCGMQMRCRWNRTLDLGAGQLYPAVGVLLAKNDVAMRPPTTLPKQAHTEAQVERYVVACRASMTSSIDTETLEAMRSERRPLVLWGAGSHAQRLLSQTALGACAIDCIIDADVGKQGRRLSGYLVVPPEEGIARAKALDADVAIAIAVNAEAVVDRLRNALPAMRVIRL